MLIKATSEVRGFLSATNTRLGRQVVHIMIDNKNQGSLSGDELNEQLKKQGFEIVDYKKPE